MFNQLGLYTDFYELTMAQGFFKNGWSKKKAGFDYFFRSLPFEGGYLIFAGLSDLLEMLNRYRFSKDDLKYLRSKGFEKPFLNYLKDFRFQGNIYSCREGEIVFPNEIIVRVEGNIIETQLIETLLLNILNFESLIATKASRVCYAAKGRKVIDFGLRRAQGFGGFHASKAAAIGGVTATSNVMSANEFELEVSGTQAHSWIEAFEDELTAFRKFAELYPDNCVLLVDTYNTLKSGVPNAIKIANEMKSRGRELKAIRLDSGDLAYLSKKSREMLDKEGFKNVKIIVSNQLDEHIIRSLLAQNAQVDIFGVGTNLITGKEDAALDGVYKLSFFDRLDRLKISDNIEKTLLPGKKKVLRHLDKGGNFYADVIVSDDHTKPSVMIHPFSPEKRLKLTGFAHENLLIPVMKKGKSTLKENHVSRIAEYASKRLSQLPEEHKRFENPHIYKVGVSNNLLKKRNKMIKDIRSKFE
jgi:nicotinate phosphoribosyltransferase